MIRALTVSPEVAGMTIDEGGAFVLSHALGVLRFQRSLTMIVGVIGSGSIGPDLAYGFLSALARGPFGF